MSDSDTDTDIVHTSPTYSISTNTSSTNTSSTNTCSINTNAGSTDTNDIDTINTDINMNAINNINIINDDIDVDDIDDKDDKDDIDNVDEHNDVDDMHDWGKDMMLFFKSLEENEKLHDAISSNSSIDSNDTNDIGIICNDNDISTNDSNKYDDDACQERYYFTRQRDNLYSILSMPTIDSTNDCHDCKNLRPFPTFITISSSTPALGIKIDPPSLDEYINEPRYPVCRSQYVVLPPKPADKNIVSLWPEDHDHLLSLLPPQAVEQEQTLPSISSTFSYEDPPNTPYEYESYDEEFKENSEREGGDRNDKIVDASRYHGMTRNRSGDLFLCALHMWYIFLCFLSCSVAVIQLYLHSNNAAILNSTDSSTDVSSLSLIFTNDNGSKILAYYIIITSVLDSLFLARELRNKLNLWEPTKVKVSVLALALMTFVQDFIRRNCLYYRFAMMILLLGVGGTVGPVLSTMVGCSAAAIYLFDD